MRIPLYLIFGGRLLAGRLDSAPDVEVFVPPVTNQTTNQTLQRAKTIVDEIFSDIGVKVRWQTGSAPGCSREAMHRRIVMNFSWDTPARVHPGAAAYSKPFSESGPCVTVFMDRLTFRGSAQANSGELLGHVIAHEVAHVLQGITRHSASGILSAQWTNQEIHAMLWEHLRFTPDDARLILKGVREGTRIQPVGLSPFTPVSAAFSAAHALRGYLVPYEHWKHSGNQRTQYGIGRHEWQDSANADKPHCS